MRQFDHKVLQTKGMAGRWFDGGENLAAFDQLKSVLNGYADQGWVFRSHTCTESGYHFVIMERPAQPRELLPGLDPAGRGDEVSPDG